MLPIHDFTYRPVIFLITAPCISFFAGRYLQQEIKKKHDVNITQYLFPETHQNQNEIRKPTQLTIFRPASSLIVKGMVVASIATMISFFIVGFHQNIYQFYKSYHVVCDGLAALAETNFPLTDLIKDPDSDLSKTALELISALVKLSTDIKNAEEILIKFFHPLIFKSFAASLIAFIAGKMWEETN